MIYFRKGKKKYLQLREKNEMKSYFIPFNSASIFQAAIGDMSM